MSSIDDLLARARTRIDRVQPAAALEEMRAGAVLVDVRAESQIARDGTVPGAIVSPAMSWNGAAPRTATIATRASATRTDG